MVGISGVWLIFLINQNYISPATALWSSVWGRGEGGQGIVVEVYTIWRCINGYQYWGFRVWEQVSSGGVSRVSVIQA